MTTEQRWLSVNDVAAELGLYRRTVTQMIHRGELRAINVGSEAPRTRHYRIARADLDAFIEGRVVVA